jgi:hypothetical protein
VTFIAVNSSVNAGQCISNASLGNSHATCPAANMADATYSEGPVPLGGGSMVNLFAQVSATPAAGNTQQVTVLVNGVASTLSCQISNPATTCTAAGPVAVAAGAYLQVEITNVAGTYAGRTWRVSFRY